MFFFFKEDEIEPNKTDSLHSYEFINKLIN